MRLTMAQALVRFLAAQYAERDGVEQRFIEGCFGIFGHGNVAGVGEALFEQPDLMTYYQARNEQAMRVFTSPAETGAVTLALPQDVQAEAYEYPADFFERRVWSVPRAEPDSRALDRAAAMIHAADRPMIVAGGGVIYSDATASLR